MAGRRGICGLDEDESWSRSMRELVKMVDMDVIESIDQQRRKSESSCGKGIMISGEIRLLLQRLMGDTDIDAH